MVRKLKVSDVLKPSPPDDTYRKITAWHQTENPPPDEILKWLTHVEEQFRKTVQFLMARVKLFQLSNDEVLIASVKLTGDNALDFIDRAAVAAKYLAGSEPGQVSDAFVEGVRIGLLYEKQMSLIDGRYTEKWQHELARQKAGENSALLKSDSEVLLLEVAYAKHRGQPKEYQKIANELFEHGIKGRNEKAISAKTVKRELIKRGLLDNAKRCP